MADNYINEELIVKIEPSLSTQNPDDVDETPGLTLTCEPCKVEMDDVETKDNFVENGNPPVNAMDVSTDDDSEKIDFGGYHEYVVSDRPSTSNPHPNTSQDVKKYLYHCLKCPKKFISAHFLNEHNVAKHLPKLFGCHLCADEFHREILLEDHLKIKHGKGEACDTCDRFFKTTKALNIHKKNHEKNNEIPKILQNQTVAIGSYKYIKCQKCNMRFITAQYLEQHTRERHKIKEFTCEVCSKVFKHKGDLNRHSSVHSNEKQFVCSVCEKSFSQNSTLKLHEKAVHANDKRFTCMVCEKVFLQSGDLKKHRVVHTGEKQFVCELCSKSYTQSSSLKAHKAAVHSKMRPFICDVCTKAFSSLGNLKQHMLVHSGDRPKPFSCATCSASFTSKSHMKTHILDVHCDEKPFTCELCGKSFSRNSSLKMHMSVHTGEKPFGCDYCSKAFASRANLKQHMPFHTGEKPFVCKICGKSFAHRGNYRSHSAVHNVTL